MSSFVIAKISHTNQFVSGFLQKKKNRIRVVLQYSIEYFITILPGKPKLWSDGCFLENTCILFEWTLYKYWYCHEWSFIPSFPSSPFQLLNYRSVTQPSGSSKTNKPTLVRNHPRNQIPQPQRNRPRSQNPSLPHYS